MKRDRMQLYAGVAGAVALAAAGGFGIAKVTSDDKPAATANKGEAEHAGDAVAMSPQAATSAGILVQEVASGDLASEIVAQANVSASPDGQAVLTASTAGTVTRVFKRLGDPVRAGETVAIVASRDAAQFTSDRSVAGARSSLAQQKLAREKSLYEQGVSPRADYEEARAEAAVAAAEAHRAQLAAGAARVTADGRGVIVTSPISGRITAAPASLGAFVQPETELFRVADPALIQVEASVGGQDAPRIAPGDRAVLDLGDGRTLEGRVRSITPTLNAESRSATAVIEVAGGGLQPGQAVRVRILPRTAGTGRAIVVPEEAVQAVGGRDVVFVRTAQGFRPQPVTVTRRSAGRAEIATGLTPGMTIVVRNAFLLKAELGKGEGGDEH